jgi:hypothetical protein
MRAPLTIDLFFCLFSPFSSSVPQTRGDDYCRYSGFSPLSSDAAGEARRVVIDGVDEFGNATRTDSMTEPAHRRPRIAIRARSDMFCVYAEGIYVACIYQHAESTSSAVVQYLTNVTVATAAIAADGREMMTGVRAATAPSYSPFGASTEWLHNNTATRDK